MTTSPSTKRSSTRLTLTGLRWPTAISSNSRTSKIWNNKSKCCRKAISSWRARNKMTSKKGSHSNQDPGTTTSRVRIIKRIGTGSIRLEEAARTGIRIQWSKNNRSSLIIKESMKRTRPSTEKNRPRSRDTGSTQVKLMTMPTTNQLTASGPTTAPRSKLPAISLKNLGSRCLTLCRRHFKSLWMKRSPKPSRLKARSRSFLSSLWTMTMSIMSFLSQRTKRSRICVPPTTSLIGRTSQSVAQWTGSSSKKTTLLYSLSKAKSLTIQSQWLMSPEFRMRRRNLLQIPHTRNQRKLRRPSGTLFLMNVFEDKRKNRTIHLFIISTKKKTRSKMNGKPTKRTPTLSRHLHHTLRRLLVPRETT